MNRAAVELGRFCLASFVGAVALGALLVLFEWLAPSLQ